MTPSLPDILVGNFLCLADPPPPESAGEFMAGRVGATALLSLLAAQEAERGLTARVWENDAIRVLLSEAAPVHGEVFAAAATAGSVDDFTLAGLDRANAALRRALIALHEAVEAAGDTERDHAILRLYRDMAHARRLVMPPLPGR
ncbi:hypothetical protein [Caulobacter sp. DWR1-3-2b1]|uniref:hypothetical protein n=1 Tax=Caulobacter sp. DWR1-3-2b1 TaxID=2804670 RepID=UPI003CE9BDF7